MHGKFSIQFGRGEKLPGTVNIAQFGFDLAAVVQIYARAPQAHGLQTRTRFYLHFRKIAVDVQHRPVGKWLVEDRHANTTRQRGTAGLTVDDVQLHRVHAVAPGAQATVGKPYYPIFAEHSADAALLNGKRPFIKDKLRLIARKIVFGG